MTLQKPTEATKKINKEMAMYEKVNSLAFKVVFVLLSVSCAKQL